MMPVDVIMVSVKQVHFIEGHWEAIARRALSRIHRELAHSHAFTDAMILERSEDLIGHLGDWLTSPNSESLARYEEVGERRAAAHVALHDVVRMLQLLRQSAIDYVRENELNDSSITLRAENELEYDIGRFFDLIIYHMVKGYEAALRHQHANAAAAS